MCIINEDHMIYGSWDKERDRQNFLSFWAVFLPLPPSPDNIENQNLEKMKKTPGHIILLHMCIINEDHMIYGS